MTKSQAKALFDQLYPADSFIHFTGSKMRKTLDTIARAEAWNNFTDELCKSRRISAKQYDTWTHPWRD